MNDLTIRGATMFFGARSDLHVAGNLFVDAHTPGAPVIDADGLIALPGLVDPHCHLREPSDDTPAETLVSGTAAAARGGFTCVAAMPNTTPACDTAQQARWLLRQAKDPALSARVVPIGAVTKDRAGTELADLAGMYNAGVRLFSDDGAAVASLNMMREACLEVAYLGGVIADHCQSQVMAGPRAWWPDNLSTDDADDPPSDEIWPQAAETSIVMRDVQVASDIGCHIHLCHISCAESVEVIRWAKRRGIPVTAEVTPHHLLLTSDLLSSGDTRFKVNPPLRSAEDVEALRAGLQDGTINMIGTDHAPHTAAAKNKPMPDASPGMTGLEQALAVVMETMVNPGRLDWLEVAWLMSFMPARLLLRLRNQARAMGPGIPANVVLIDPERRHIVDAQNTASLARNNPYAGLDLPDPVMLTLWAGKVTQDRLR